MKFKTFNRLMLAGLMAMAVGSPLMIQADDATQVAIYHTNDTHSRTDGYAKTKTVVAQDKADATFLFDAGDTLHGLPFATIPQGESIVTIMNAMGYDAMTTGNHDYNYGIDRLIELSTMTNFPVLAANVTRNGKTVFDKTAVIEKNGVKVGVFGLATPETSYKTNPNNVKGVDFGDKDEIIKDAQKAVDELTEEGCDIVVALTHLGIDKDSEVKSYDVAENVKGLDLVIDGHSHSSLTDYADFNASHDVQIVSNGEYQATLGKVNITLDENKEITSITPESIDLTNVEADPTVSEAIANINAEQEVVLSEVIGNTSVDLIGERNVVRYGHSNLGYLLADAMLKETGADIAITNGGGIRASIPAGEITKKEVVTVLPFGNYVVTKKVTGANIIKALEHGMVIGAGSFTHFSGMDVVTEIDGINHKVVSVTVDGEPLDMEKEYVVAMNDFMAVGGDDYIMLNDAASGKVLNEYAALDEVLIKYIQSLTAEEVAAYNNVSHLTSTSLGWSKNAEGQWTYGKDTQWVACKDGWYYVVDGVMVVNTWIPREEGSNIYYYVNADGKMVTNQIVDGHYINSYGLATR